MSLAFYGKHPKSTLRAAKLALKAIKGVKPQFLVLETTKRCNANCVYCATKDRRGDMPFSLYKAVVDAAPSVEQIIPVGRGEPLLCDYIVEAVEYARKAGKKVQITTNGQLMDYDMSQALLKAGVDCIWFSIDDNTKEGFEKNRRGLSFETVLSNLQEMIHLRDKMNVRAEIYIRATLNENNQDRVCTIENFYRAFCDGFIAGEAIAVPEPEEERLVRWHPAICSKCWKYLNVWYDGELAFCCNDWHNSYRLGFVDENITSQELFKLYNSPPFQNIRRRMLTSKVPLICKRCLIRKEKGAEK